MRKTSHPRPSKKSFLTLKSVCCSQLCLPADSTYKSDILLMFTWTNLQPLSQEKVHIFCCLQKLGLTNIVFHEPLEAQSSPLLSSLTLCPSGASAGPIIKEQVCLSVSLTAARRTKTHQHVHTLQITLVTMVSLDTVPWYNFQRCGGRKRFTQPPKNTHTHTTHSSTGKPSILSQNPLGSNPLEDIRLKVREA